MVEFAKSRGFLGYGVLPGGRNDKDSSHAVLPLAEYDELLRRIAVAERDKHEAIEQAKRTIGRERAAAEQRAHPRPGGPGRGGRAGTGDGHGGEADQG